MAPEGPQFLGRSFHSRPPWWWRPDRVALGCSPRHTLVQPPPPGRPPESPGSAASPLQNLLYPVGNGFASWGSSGFSLALPASMNLVCLSQTWALLGHLTGPVLLWASAFSSAEVSLGPSAPPGGIACRSLPSLGAWDPPLLRPELRGRWPGGPPGPSPADQAVSKEDAMVGEATLLGERKGPGCAEPAHSETEGQPMSGWLSGGGLLCTLGLSGGMRP